MDDSGSIPAASALKRKFATIQDVPPIITVHSPLRTTTNSSHAVHSLINVQANDPEDNTKRRLITDVSETMKNTLLQFFEDKCATLTAKGKVSGWAVKEKRDDLRHGHWTTGDNAAIAYSSLIDSGACADVYAV